MARPLRLELAGSLYHVTSRGDGREDIYLSDEDRVAWLDTLGQVCERFNWVCHAYCLMSNHYHLSKWGQTRFNLQVKSSLTVRSNSSKSSGLKSRPGNCPYAR